MVAVAQSNAGFGSRTLSTITAGHLLVICYGSANQAPWTPSGYTQIPDGTAVAFNNDFCSIWYKTAGAGESTSLTVPNGTFGVCWIEVDTGMTFGTSHEDVGPSGQLQTTPNPGAISVANGSIVFSVATNGTDGGWGANSFTPPGGWTEIMDITGPVNHPTIWTGYKVSSGGSENAQPVCTSAGWWSAQIASFGPTAQPRASGIII